MKTLFILSLLLTIPTFAQLPPNQVVRGDGAETGNVTKLWINRNLSLPENRELVRVRLAGIKCPESTGGGLTHLLALSSASALARVVSESLLSLDFVSEERIKVFEDNQQKEITQYVAFIKIANQTIVPKTNFSESYFEWKDVGAEMLLRGMAYIDSESYLELQNRNEAESYFPIQYSAMQMKRGIWAYAFLFKNHLVIRPAMPDERNLPQRKP